MVVRMRAWHLVVLFTLAFGILRPIAVFPTSDVLAAGNAHVALTRGVPSYRSYAPFLSRSPRPRLEAATATMAQTPTCPSGQYPAMSGGCAPPSSTSICSGGTLTGTNLTVTPACGAVGALATIQHIHVYAGDCAFYDSVSGYHYVLHCSDGSSMQFAIGSGPPGGFVGTC